MRAALALRKAPRELADARRVLVDAPTSATATPGSFATPRVNERARAQLVSIVLLIYLLAIFEGSIRKYLLPQFGQYVFFIRDPIVVYAYVLAARFGLWPRDSAFLKLGVCMGLFGGLLFVMQVATGGASETRLLLGAYGWRSYFLYVPLAFLIGAQFRAADLLRFAKLTLWLALPIAVLVALQFFAPMNAVINVGIAAEKELQFTGMGLNAVHIRPTGPFTSSAGQQQFAATACAFLLGLWLLPAKQRKFGVVPLTVAAGALMTCVALSGSRGTMLQCALSGAFALAVAFIGRGAAFKAKALALPLSLGAAAIALYPIVFPEGFKAFVERWDGAAAAEAGFQGGVFGRSLFGFVDFLRLVDAVPALGYGLGYGGNASITLRATVDGVMPGLLAETDYARHMVDLGAAFGIGYIAFRIALALWLTRHVVRATRRAANPLPMLLLSYAAYVVLLGQLTGNGSINIYGWLFTGLCIAASREALLSTLPQARTHPAAVRPETRAPRSRFPFTLRENNQ